MPSIDFRPVLILAVFALAGCGQGAGDAPAQATPEPESTTAGSAANEAAAVTIERTPSPEGARVYFVTPTDGDTMTGPVTIEFGIEGMTVVRAGVEEAASGHHHLIIDAGLPPLDAPIPASEHYIHFGDASTSTTIDLEPGEHTLQLILGDHRHFPHDPPVTSDVITITVE
ncbi:MAG: DUF4399 domain-containing protein [Woeseiaceae bacterium]|jgi:hypothetical protein|nr:DUF4399 domain-containing protein [Woeseiaceae bacterium]